MWSLYTKLFKRLSLAEQCFNARERYLKQRNLNPFTPAVVRKAYGRFIREHLVYAETCNILQRKINLDDFEGLIGCQLITSESYIQEIKKDLISLFLKDGFNVWEYICVGEDRKNYVCHISWGK